MLGITEQAVYLSSASWIWTYQGLISIWTARGL